VRTVQTTPKLATAMRTYLQLVRACADTQAGSPEAAGLEAANRQARGPEAPVRSPTEAAVGGGQDDRTLRVAAVAGPSTRHRTCGGVRLI
jgi:hypothetical protein